MGELICVCDEADMMNCDRCKKYQETKPDSIMRHPRWPRNSRGHKQAVHPDARRSDSDGKLRGV